MRHAPPSVNYTIKVRVLHTFHCVLDKRFFDPQTDRGRSKFEDENMTIEVLSEGEGLKDVELFHLSRGAPAVELVRLVAARGGFAVDEAFLFLEGADDPIEVSGVVIDERFQGRPYHVHRARGLLVHVNYQNLPKEHRYSPATTVQQVLDWATGPNGFKIDRAIAPEMELALEGSEVPLPRSAHLGRFAHHPSQDLRFDLIRGIIPNGRSAR